MKNNHEEIARKALNANKKIKNRKRILIVVLIISLLANFVFIPLFIIRIYKDAKKIEFMEKTFNSMSSVIDDIKINADDAMIKYEEDCKRFFETTDSLEKVAIRSHFQPDYLILICETRDFIEELRMDSIKSKMKMFQDN